MDNINKTSKIVKLSFLVLFLSLILGFYLQEDLSTGGASSDFYIFIWKFTLELGYDLHYHYINWEEAHLPLHFIILSGFNYFLNDETSVRLLFCIISILIPLLFYLNLKIRFNNINRDTLLIFTSLLFILPSFRYTAIWSNIQITALIFFLSSIFFYLKWEEKKIYKIDLNLILQILLMTLAVYTRVDFSLFFLFFMIIYFQKLKLIDFLKLSILVLLLSLHGVWFVYNHLVTFSNIKFTSEFQNHLLVNSSIMSFYLMPLFFSLFITNKNIFKKEIKFFLISLIFFSFIVFLLSNYFNYNYTLGGGFLLKLSHILFNNNILFYLSSIIGFVFLSYLSKKNINNLAIVLLILLGYSSSVIFQKYFEPTFLIIFFLLIQSTISTEFFKNRKNILYTYIYFIIYFGSAVINNFFEYSKNI